MCHDDFVVNVVLLIVRFVHGIVGQRFQFGIFSQTLEPSRFDAVPDLHYDVAHESHDQHYAHDVQLLPGAQVCAVRVRYHETDRFPQTEVAERRLLVSPEQRAVDSC